VSICLILLADLTISVRYAFVEFYLQFNGSVLWIFSNPYIFTVFVYITAEIAVLQICNIGSSCIHI